MCHCHLSPDCLAICSGTKASSGTEASDHETAEGIQELDLRVWVLTYTCPRRYHMRQQVPHFVNCDIQIENKKICSKIIAGRPYNCRTLQCKLGYSRLILSRIHTPLPNLSKYTNHVTSNCSF